MYGKVMVITGVLRLILYLRDAKSSEFSWSTKLKLEKKSVIKHLNSWLSCFICSPVSLWTM